MSTIATIPYLRPARTAAASRASTIDISLTTDTSE
jgi:hypothetical protein